MSVEKRREFVEKLRQQPPAAIRHVVEENFLAATDILTYNWINGNPRANWEGKPFDWYPAPGHYRDWYNRIQANPANMFLAARKHTKTTFADCLMIWKSEFTPGHSSLYWANTENQVQDRMEELEEIVDANPWLENVHTGGALTSKTFENGSRILTTWVTGAVEGGHVDLQLGDDPMKELGDISDSEIEAWYGRVIVPTLNPDGLQAVIGTRKRPNDLYNLLREKHEGEAFADDIPSYTLSEYPAVREAWEQEYDRPGDLAPKALYTEVTAPDLADALGLASDTVHVLWPEARDVDFLKKNLGMQGRSYFFREFCMVSRQAEDAIVQRDWVEDVTEPRAPPVSLSDAWTPADYPEQVTRETFDRVVVGHDPAGKGRDRFGFVTLGTLTHPHDTLPAALQALAVDDEGTPRDVTVRHVLDVWQAQDVPPSRWRAKLESLTDRYAPDVIGIESNLNATWVMDDDEIPRRVQQRIEPIATGRGKHSWKDGVPSIGSDIEAGKYRFYSEGEAMTGDLVDALTSVERDPDTGELVGHTPDLVMALYMAHKALETGGAKSSRGSMDSSGDPEQDAKNRETRRELQQSEIGRAILDSRDSLY